MPETTVLKVLLHCDGCVSKVKRHLRRLEGVESLHVDQKNSKVTVYGPVKPRAVLDQVLRAGKSAEFWPQPEATPMAEPAVIEVVGGKKKTADGGGNGCAKKQKSASKIKREELVEYDGGDGEIVNDEPKLPSVEIAYESDTQGLMDKTPATPGKQGRNINRRG